MIMKTNPIGGHDSTLKYRDADRLNLNHTPALTQLQQDLDTPVLNAMSLVILEANAQDSHPGIPRIVGTVQEDETLRLVKVEEETRKGTTTEQTDEEEQTA